MDGQRWAAQGGLLPGSRHSPLVLPGSSHSPPCSHSIPFPRAHGDSMAVILTIPSDQERGKSLHWCPCWPRRAMAWEEQRPAQPPVTCIPRLLQQPCCSARTLHNSPCQASTKPRPEIMPSPSPGKSPKAPFCRKINRKMGRDKVSCSSF